MIPNLTGLQQLVHFTFIMTFMGMIAGAIFFALQKNSVAESYRASMAVSSVICAIAAMNYYYMKDIYIVGVASESGRFPTEFRYIDWILTVPLMLIKFPALLGIGRRATPFLIQLETLAVVMIVTGFIGEINIGQPTIHFGLFGVSMVAWILITYMLFSSLSELPEHVNEVKRMCIKRMAIFVLGGWCIYPIGYLTPSFIGIAPDVRELVYNIGDLINKVGLALVVYTAACSQSKLEKEELEAQASS
jgi:sensory rhodopsin